MRGGWLWQLTKSLAISFTVLILLLAYEAIKVTQDLIAWRILSGYVGASAKNKTMDDMYSVQAGSSQPAASSVPLILLSSRLLFKIIFNVCPACYHPPPL